MRNQIPSLNPYSSSVCCHQEKALVFFRKDGLGRFSRVCRTRVKAIKACRVYGAKLVIAELDRLSRDAHFLLGLEKAGVDFVCADMPNANRLTKERERRDKAIEKAQGALEKAEREHAKKAAAIQAEAEALEKRSRAEDARWYAERERLQTALRRARG